MKMKMKQDEVVKGVMKREEVQEERGGTLWKEGVQPQTVSLELTSTSLPDLGKRPGNPG